MLFALLALAVARQGRPVTTPIPPPKKASQAAAKSRPSAAKPAGKALPVPTPTFSDRAAGQGQPAVSGDLVTVSFLVKRRGEVIGDSERRGFPFTFRIGESGNDPLLEMVVKGMRVGGIRVGRVNAKAVYGPKGAPPLIAAGDALDVSVTLIARSPK